jgi:hypothetical protein
MQARKAKHGATLPIVIAALFVGLAMHGALAAPAATPAQCDANQETTTAALDNIDLAAFHLEYLLLDEVIAGRGPDVAHEIELAVQRLACLRKASAAHS